MNGWRLRLLMTCWRWTRSWGAEERDVDRTVQDFMDASVRPHVVQWYLDGTLRVRERLAPELGKLGLLGMHLQGYGCAGTSATMYGLPCRELDAVDSGLRSLVSVQGSLAMFAISASG